MQTKIDDIKVYSKKDNKNELFSKSNIDEAAGQLENAKNDLKNYDSKPKSNFFGKDEPSKAMRNSYMAYYRAELADSIKQFSYGNDHDQRPKTKKHESKSVNQLLKEGKQPSTTQPVKTYFSSSNLLDTAAELADRNIKFAICNPANDKQIGGGAFIGSPNFEEDLARVSNFSIALVDHAREDGDLHYNQSNPPRPEYNENNRLQKDQALITTEVNVIKKINFAEKDHWYFKQYEPLPKEKQFSMTVVTNAAIALDKRRSFNETEKAETKERIRAQLTALIEAGIDVPVLSDFGCGGFNNIPKEVATIYYELLYEEGYAQFFTDVRFNIIHPDNYADFLTLFKEKLPKNNPPIEATTPTQNTQQKKTNNAEPGNTVLENQPQTQMNEDTVVTTITSHLTKLTQRAKELSAKGKSEQAEALNNFVNTISEGLNTYETNKTEETLKTFKSKCETQIRDVGKALEAHPPLLQKIREFAAFIFTLGSKNIKDRCIKEATGFSIFNTGTTKKLLTTMHTDITNIKPPVPR